MIAWRALCSLAVLLPLAAKALPPDTFPLRIAGDVSTGTAVYRYVAVWDESLGGYFFAPPGRPAGWEAATTLTIDAAGQVLLGGVPVADWSQGPLGHPISSGSFVFSPVEYDMGYGWYLPRILTWYAWGWGAGFMLDLVNILWILGLQPLVAGASLLFK